MDTQVERKKVCVGLCSERSVKREHRHGIVAVDAAVTLDDSSQMF